MDALSRYNRVFALLPSSLRGEIKVSDKLGKQAEEIRFRAGRKASVLISEGEIVTGTRPVEVIELEGIMEIVTGASAYAVRDCMKSGYITAKGGYRIGVCGKAVVKDGAPEGVGEISSLAIRIPREMVGVGNEVAAQLVKSGKFRSTLIISPPGVGKTTLLRDIVRILSDGDADLGIKGTRVALADERGEIACLYRGVPERNVGSKTDVMEGCPKAKAVMLLLRTMNPRVIALDEITESADITAIYSCANCGVEIIATAHAESIQDLKNRKLYVQLLDSGVFKNAVFIEKSGSSRKYRVIDLSGGNL